MVELVVLQSLSYMAGAIGVCIAAIYYVFTLRNTTNERRRQTLMMRMPALDKEYYNNYFAVLNMRDCETPEEFFEKHESLSEDLAKIVYVMNVYNTIGQLYMDGLIGIEEVSKIAQPYPIIMLFERFWWLIVGNRKNYLGEDMIPEYFVPLEFLYREMKRRYPKVKIGVSWEESFRGFRENVWSKTSREDFLKSVLI